MYIHRSVFCIEHNDAKYELTKHKPNHLIRALADICKLTTSLAMFCRWVFARTMPVSLIRYKLPFFMSLWST